VTDLFSLASQPSPRHRDPRRYVGRRSFRIVPLTQAVDRRNWILPDAWEFGGGAPGFRFIAQLSAALRNTITLVLGSLVLVRIVMLLRYPDAEIFGFLLTLSLTLICYAPPNAIGGSGNYRITEIWDALHSDAEQQDTFFTQKTSISIASMESMKLFSTQSIVKHCSRMTPTNIFPKVCGFDYIPFVV
jgi:hypothetical protein